MARYLQEIRLVIMQDTWQRDVKDFDFGSLARGHAATVVSSSVGKRISVEKILKEAMGAAWVAENKTFIPKKPVTRRRKVAS
jgi:hypothetical protein